MADWNTGPNDGGGYHQLVNEYQAPDDGFG
jgi:hypothetical protein